MATATLAPLSYLKTIGIVNNGNNGRGFANPYDIAHARDGRIFVINRCDTARRAAIRVNICNLDEEFLGEFGYGYGDGDGQLVQPVAMAFDSKDAPVPHRRAQQPGERVRHRRQLSLKVGNGRQRPRRGEWPIRYRHRR